MISFQEVAVMDKNSDFRGVPPISLMEEAGRSLAEEIEERYPEKNILFVCGTGNNAGDAFVAARYLKEWRGNGSITVYLLKDRHKIRSEISRKNFEKLDCEIIKELDWDDLEEYVIVDALLGTGVTGKIREPYRTTINNINNVKNPIISVDVPSGLISDIQINPDITVTFHDVKKGMNKVNCGEIIVKDIGIPEKAEKFTGPGEMLLYPYPDKDSHKGDNGTLLIVGGGPYTGAPSLAGKAAYRAGADLVYLAVPDEVKDVIAGFSPSFITKSLKGDRMYEEHIPKIIELSKKCDAALIGPGIGTEEDTYTAIRGLLKKLEIPTILDADALKAIKDHESILKENTILTPHKGEFKMLTGKTTDLKNTADDYAKENDVTLVIKGRVDYITDGNKSKENDFGTPAMTVGGTGDTLAGVIGALLSKNMAPFDAARVGTYLTCRAGEIAFEKTRWGLMPEDVSESICDVFKEQL